MTRTSPRAALTACAEHVRVVYGLDAADLIKVWRDRHFPLVTRTNHRWLTVRTLTGGVWIERRCERCGTVEDFAPLKTDGKTVAHYVLPDGSVVKKSDSPTPPCTTDPALSRPTHERH